MPPASIPKIAGSAPSHIVELNSQLTLREQLYPLALDHATTFPNFFDRIWSMVRTGKEVPESTEFGYAETENPGLQSYRDPSRIGSTFPRLASVLKAFAGG